MPPTLVYALLATTIVLAALICFLLVRLNAAVERAIILFAAVGKVYLVETKLAREGVRPAHRDASEEAADHALRLLVAGALKKPPRETSRPKRERSEAAQPS